MPGVYHLDIKESAEELKQMLSVQKIATVKEKVQALYLLKTGYGKTVSKTAKILGRNRSTVQEWLRVYRNQGIEGLLVQKHSPGRPRAIPKWAEKALTKQLHQPEGFNDYQEIVEWLQQNCGIEAKYKTVYKLVHYRLESSPKVPRPKSVEQSQQRVEAFKKK
ncbi:MAG: helix-turn-helix domain-containing protein [Aulosira sp. ZfuCHP01]|nr:helix-turn-helix domain-containing protein [Aulosira sp. DedVER01a]MDZ8056623.1 helix-turn-helix domain-containing protein [Aulosira sp. ZfuCHP01]